MMIDLYEGGEGMKTVHEKRTHYYRRLAVPQLDVGQPRMNAIMPDAGDKM